MMNTTDLVKRVKKFRKDAGFDASNPASGGSSITPIVNTRSGIWLPFAVSDFPATSGVVGTSTQGVANLEQFQTFILQTSIQVGHVAFSIGTGLAGAFFGVAIYSGDGTTKLTAADGVSVAAAGIKYIALSTSFNLQPDTVYGLGWTCTDASTVTIDNVLQINDYNIIKNASGVIQYGRDTVDATAGGVTLSNVPFANLSSAQLRIPLFFFSE